MLKVWFVVLLWLFGELYEYHCIGTVDPLYEPKFGFRLLVRIIRNGQPVRAPLLFRCFALPGQPSYCKRCPRKLDLVKGFYFATQLVVLPSANSVQFIPASAETSTSSENVWQCNIVRIPLHKIQKLGLLVQSRWSSRACGTGRKHQNHCTNLSNQKALFSYFIWPAKGGRLFSTPGKLFLWYFRH